MLLYLELVLLINQTIFNNYFSKNLSIFKNENIKYENIKT